MGLVKSIESFFNKTSVVIRSALVSYSERKNIHKKKNLIKRVSLTAAQIKEINLFFKEFYGKKIPLYWHKLYQSYTGSFQKDYFPEILFSTKLEPIANPYRIAEFLGDKNLIPVLFKDIEEVHIPHTYISCTNNLFQDSERHYILLDDVKNILKNVGFCVIKKSVDTSSGRDVQVCNIIDGIDLKTKKKVSEIIADFGDNFVVQEFVRQNHVLANLNKSSVNTFRVITYILDGKVFTCPLALRMGRSSSDRDNIHYGGLSIGVNEDGSLMSTAFSEYGNKYTEHPDTKVVFKDYLIGENFVKKTMRAAMLLHERVPYLKILSWDLTIDEDGMVTIIEVNTTGQSAWFPQMVTGKSLFGFNTSKILKLIRK